MAWEDRQGSKYYYLKQRIGTHVKSLYIGNSVRAYILQAMNEIKREEDDAYRRMVAEEKERESEYNRFHELANNLVGAVMILNGYHAHKGEWRKKRG